MSYTDMYGPERIIDPLKTADIVAGSAKKCYDAASEEHDDEKTNNSALRLKVAKEALVTLETAVNALKLASDAAVLESDKLVALAKRWNTARSGTIESATIGESWHAQRVLVLAAKACVESAIEKLADSTHAERKRQAEWNEIWWDACTLKQALVVLKCVVETRRANGTAKDVWWNSDIVKKGRAMLKAELATQNSRTLRKIRDQRAAERAAALPAADAAGGAGCST
jgi:hypothetical protein